MGKDKEILSTIEAIRSSKGSALSFTDMYQLLVIILKSLPNPANDPVLVEELRNIKKDIDIIKDEIQADSTGSDTFDILPLAIADLGDVYKTCESSAEGILDATDRAQKLIAEGADNAAIQEQLMKVYENCNFQDLTGQRITRVVKNLERFEKTTMRVFRVLLGNDLINKTGKLEYNNTNMLNGPELIKNAPSQDEIDKLFA
ncbi:MAG: protein phosphatase CheZ [Rickettsiales bacterium]